MQTGVLTRLSVWNLYLGISVQNARTFQRNYIVFLFPISHEILKITFNFASNYMGFITFTIFRMTEKLKIYIQYLSIQSDKASMTPLDSRKQCYVT